MTLRPGESLVVGALRVTVVSIEPRPLAVRIRVGEGRCGREVALGPGPAAVQAGPLSLALGPGTTAEAAEIVLH